MRLSSSGSSCYRLRSAGSDVSDSPAPSSETSTTSPETTAAPGNHSSLVADVASFDVDRLISILNSDWDPQVENNGEYIVSAGFDLRLKLGSVSVKGSTGSFVAVRPDFHEFAWSNYSEFAAKISKETLGSLSVMQKEKGGHSSSKGIGASIALPFQFGYGDLSAGYGGFSENISLTARGVRFGIKAAFNSEDKLRYLGFSVGPAAGAGLTIDRVSTVLHDVQWHSYNIEHIIMNFMSQPRSFRAY